MWMVLVPVLMAAVSYQHAADLFRKGKLEEANQAITEYLAAHPEDAAALLLRGRLSMALNRFDQARESFQGAVKVQPDSAETQFLLGFFYYVDNDFALAIDPLEAAHKLKPSDPRPALYLAMTHDGLAEVDKAVSFFEKAMRLELASGQRSAETHLAYARALARLGRMKPAEVQADAALALEPNSRDALYEKARLLLERGEAETAVALAEKALGQPGSAAERSIHFLLSRAYSKLGREDLATEHRRKFEAIPPRLVR
jgi:tetratricopeptide (TPR) repeat protein